MWDCIGSWDNCQDILDTKATPGRLHYRPFWHGLCNFSYPLNPSLDAVYPLKCICISLLFNGNPLEGYLPYTGAVTTTPVDTDFRKAMCKSILSAWPDTLDICTVEVFLCSLCSQTWTAHNQNETSRFQVMHFMQIAVQIWGVLKNWKKKKTMFSLLYSFSLNFRSSQLLG